MILAVTTNGAEVEAEIKLVDDDDVFARYEVWINGVWHSASNLRLFSIVSATPKERVRLALGNYDLPEAQPETQKKDPG